MVSQQQSSKSPQIDLLTGRASCPPPDIPYLLGLPSLRRAIRYSMSLADLEPKQVYGPLNKDKAIWSRIENGDMSFPADDLTRFCDIVGNDAVILWLAHHAGFDVVTMKKRMDDKDKQIEDLQRRLEEAEREKSVLAKFFKDIQR